MKFDPPLQRGTLIKRYKRFFADIQLDSGEIVTAHCPNSGSMLGCNIPGSRVYIQPTTNPKRKLKYTWELLQLAENNIVGINTIRSNSIVEEALRNGKINKFHSFENLQREVNYGENSRVDFLLTNGDESTFLEVKNVSLVENGIAMFPDSVTTRGQKHLVELMKVVASGKRAVIFFLINRQDAELFKPAEHIDRKYAELLRQAAENGVEIMVYKTKASAEFLGVDKPVPFNISS